ncbi:MAG: hypothetical protein OEZ36_05345 [Spirochaetota bacterium]|nr:hypothetical protein [Spirochaetota bacterium]
MKPAYKLLLFLSCLTLGFTQSCTPPQVKTVTLKGWPPELLAVKENNRKLPSFSCDIGFSSKTSGRRVDADGKAFVDRKNNRIKITLVDTLAGETLLDLVMIRDSVSLYLFNPQGGLILRGKAGRLDLGKYFDNIKLKLDDLVNLVKGESYLLENPDSFVRQTVDGESFYKLSQANLTELLTLDKESGRISKLVLFRDNKESFRLLYKKYIDGGDFYFPKRSDFHHSLTKSKTIIYLSNFRFSPRFHRNIFRLKSYPKASEIIDRP